MKLVKQTEPEPLTVGDLQRLKNYYNNLIITYDDVVDPWKKKKISDEIKSIKEKITKIKESCQNF